MTNTASRKTFWISSVSIESPVRKNKQMDQTSAPTPALLLDRFEMLFIVGVAKAAVSDPQVQIAEGKTGLPFSGPPESLERPGVVVHPRLTSHRRQRR